MSKLSKKLKDVLGKQKPIVLRPGLLCTHNVPKPMHGVAPRVILGAKWWNETRQAAYKSTLWRCVACCVSKFDAKGHKWLEGHELYGIDYEKGRMTYLETVPLCHYCHNYIHDGRLRAMLDEGKVTHGRFRAIIQHGDDVLFRAGHERKSRRERDEVEIDRVLNGKMCEWGKWRLVLFGKEYPPKFKTAEQWKLAFR